MSVQWESQAEPEVAPIVGAGWLLSLAAAAVSLPVDTLLRGMVAAGQGIQAILDYLGLSRMALEAQIVRLGLPMPHDRPRRRARWAQSLGGRGRSPPDCLAAGRNPPRDNRRSIGPKRRLHTIEITAPGCADARP